MYENCVDTHFQSALDANVDLHSVHDNLTSVNPEDSESPSKRTMIGEGILVKTVFSTTEITAMVSGDWNDDAMATFAHLVELKARKENKNDMLFLGLNVIKEGTDPGQKLHGKLPADKSVTRGCGFLKG